MTDKGMSDQDCDFKIQSSLVVSKLQTPPVRGKHFEPAGNKTFGRKSE